MISDNKIKRAAEIRKAEEDRKESERKADEEKRLREEEAAEEDRLEKLEEERKKSAETQPTPEQTRGGGVLSFIGGMISRALGSPPKETESSSSSATANGPFEEEDNMDEDEEIEKLEEQMKLVEQQNTEAEKKRWEKEEKDRAENETKKGDEEKGEKSKGNKNIPWPNTQDDMSNEDLAQAAGDVTLKFTESQESEFNTTLALGDSIQAGNASRARSCSFTQSSMRSFFPPRSSTMTPGHFEQDTETDTWGTPNQTPVRGKTADTNNGSSPVLSRPLKFKEENYKLTTVTPSTTPLPLMRNLEQELVRVIPAGGSKPVTVNTKKTMPKTKSMKPVPAANATDKHDEEIRKETLVKRKIVLKSKMSKYKISEENKKKLLDLEKISPPHSRTNSTKRSVPESRNDEDEDNSKMNRVNSPEKSEEASDTKEEDVSVTSDDLSSLSVLEVDINSGNTSDEEETSEVGENDETVVEANIEDKEPSNNSQSETQNPPQVGKESLEEVTKEKAVKEKVVIVREEGYDDKTSPDKKLTPKIDRTGHVKGIQAFTPNLVVNSCEDSSTDTSLMKKVKDLPVINATDLEAKEDKAEDENKDDKEEDKTE